MQGSLVRRAASEIAEHEFWLLWVLGVPLVLSSNLPRVILYAALMTIALFWMARRIARGAWSVRTPLDLPLVLLLLLGIVGVLVSLEPALSAHTLAEWFGGIAVFYGVANSAAHARIRWGVWILLALGAAMGTVGVVGLNFYAKFLPVALYPFLHKIDVTFLNPRGFTPNIVAGAVAPIIPLALAWAISLRHGPKAQRRALWRAAVIALALFLMGVVLLTQSRGALLGLIVAFTGLIVWRFPRLKWFVALLAFGALVLAVSLGPAELGELILASDSTGNAAGRWELWQRALNTYQDFPFTGIGINTFQLVVPVLYPLFVNAGSAPPHAHNLYLQMGVDLGVGGFVAFLGLTMTVLLVGWEITRRNFDAARHWVAVGLFCAYLVFAVHSLLDAVFVSSTKVGIVVWLVLGLMTALRREDAAEQ